MKEEEIKKAIEKIEYKNHSGSGRIAGIEATAQNIRVLEDRVRADVIIKGPKDGVVRKYENLEYSKDRLNKIIGQNREK
jgi:hypothetical protein